MLSIKHIPDGYFIIWQVPNYGSYSYLPSTIAILLDLNLGEYLNILFTCGAKYKSESGLYIFKFKKNAQAAIRKLEPYMIMGKLC